MTTRAEIEALIKRLEEAKKGNRELDAEIALAEGWTFQKMKGDRRAYWREAGENRWFMRQEKGPPPYTISVDAALTLVPEDPRAEITGRWDWQLECSNGGMTIWARVGADEGTRSFADTAALALCIAALRARLSSMKDDANG